MSYTLDECGARSESSTALDAPLGWETPAEFSPLAPADLSLASPLLAGVDEAGEPVHEVMLSWPEVLHATDGGQLIPAPVVRYVVDRELHDPLSGEFVLDARLSVTNATSLHDRAPIFVDGWSAHWRYSVRAVHACTDVRIGPPSPPLHVPCEVDGSVGFLAPSQDSTVERSSVENSVDITVSAMAPPGTNWDRVVVKVVDAEGVVHATLEDDSALEVGAWFLTWQPQGSPDGRYRLEGRAEQGPCAVELQPIEFDLLTTSASERCLELVRDSELPAFVERDRVLRLRLHNRCDETIFLVGLQPHWEGGPYSPNPLVEVRVDGLKRYETSMDPTPSAGESGRLLLFNDPVGWAAELAAGTTSGRIELRHELRLEQGRTATRYPSFLLVTQDQPAGYEVGPISP